MSRNSRSRCSLIALLALLLAMPQVLLRPCCCLRDQLTLTKGASEAAVDSALPPCCRQRLLKQRAAVVAESIKKLPGVHDSGRCRCQKTMEMAPSTRVVFKSLLQRGDSSPLAVHDSQIQLQAALWSSVLPVCTAPPDWRVSSAQSRLCRWLI